VRRLVAACLLLAAARGAGAYEDGEERDQAPAPRP